jgi:hypothetical protein
MMGMITQWQKLGDAETAALAQRQLDSWRLYSGNYTSFRGGSAYNADMENAAKSWAQKEADAKNVMQSLYPNAQKQAEELKETLDDTMNPQEITVEFPGAAEAGKAAHEEVAAQFPPIYQDVIVTTKSRTEPAAKGTHAGGSGGGILSSLASGIENAFSAIKGFAEGGRSDVPAIFGEGTTPEWAIPEAHTPRTASLLAAAADASGFSWGELASASSSRGNGGSSGGEGIVVHYSPVIHSDGTDGLDGILREDKERLVKTIERILDDRRMYESVVAYS